jgi:hypothetical protein
MSDAFAGQGLTLFGLGSGRRTTTRRPSRLAAEEKAREKGPCVPTGQRHAAAPDGR